MKNVTNLRVIVGFQVFITLIFLILNFWIAHNAKAIIDEVRGLKRCEVSRGE